MVPGTISRTRPSQRRRSESSVVVIVWKPTTRPVAGGTQPARRRLLVDRGEPAAVGRQSATHRVEIGPGQIPGDLARAPSSDAPAVDLDHGADLRAGAAQEDLVGTVQLGAIDRALD